MFSFLEYFTKEDADYAIHSLDGKLLGGNVVRVLNYHEVGSLDPSPSIAITQLNTSSNSTVLNGSRGEHFHVPHAVRYIQTEPPGWLTSQNTSKFLPGADATSTRAIGGVTTHGRQNIPAHRPTLPMVAVVRQALPWFHREVLLGPSAIQKLAWALDTTTVVDRSTRTLALLTTHERGVSLDDYH